MPSMDMQQQIDKTKGALSAVDNAIAQTQSALQSPSTSSDDILSLRSTLIDLQSQRAQLQSDLINLQASGVEVQPFAAAAATPNRIALTRAQSATVESLHKQLQASVVDRSVVAATIEHSTAVVNNVSQLRATMKAVPTGTAKKVPAGTPPKTKTASS